jgi:uncharacterized protein YabE (DUF348 family)
MKQLFIFLLLLVLTFGLDYKRADLTSIQGEAITVTVEGEVTEPGEVRIHPYATIRELLEEVAVTEDADVSVFNPETVLQELGLTLGEADLYEVEQTSGIREIRVRRLQTIHVDICGVVKTVQTYGETVGDLLRRLNVVLSGDMSLSHSLFTKTFDGMNLTVARVVQTTQHYMETIPFETTYCIDPELASGERKVLIPGQEGIMRCTVIVTYINGLEAERVVISQQVTQQPVDQVVAVGAAG